MINEIPTYALLDRKQLAAALSARGYTVTNTTLESWASRGGGPPFCKWGSLVRYRWGDAMAWAEQRISAPRSSTSEGERRPAA